MSKSKLGRNPLNKKHFSAVEEILVQRASAQPVVPPLQKSEEIGFLNNLQQMQIEVDIKKLFSSAVHLLSLK